MLRYGHGGFHHPVFAALFLALFLALLAALVVLGVIAVVRMWRNPLGRPAPLLRGTPQSPAIDPALNELRLRYARGDIDGDEYAATRQEPGLSPFATHQPWLGSPRCATRGTSAIRDRLLDAHEHAGTSSSAALSRP